MTSLQSLFTQSSSKAKNSKKIDTISKKMRLLPAFVLASVGAFTANKFEDTEVTTQVETTTGPVTTTAEAITEDSGVTSAISAAVLLISFV